MKNFILLSLQDRYGMHDSPDVGGDAPWWYMPLFICGLFLLVSEKSPIKPWVDENSTLAVVIFLVFFLVALPFIVVFL